MIVSYGVFRWLGVIDAGRPFWELVLIGVIVQGSFLLGMVEGMRAR